MIRFFKRIGLLLLNFFPQRVRQGSSGRMTNVLVLSIVAVCLALCISMMCSIDRKFAFFVDSFTLPATEVLTVGEESDVCYKGVPHDYLLLTPNADGTFAWKVNEAYKDTMRYFKINDLNPQKHDVDNSADQTITVHLPAYEDRPDTTLTLTGVEVWKRWREFKKQNDVQLKHLIAKIYGIDVQEHVRSFFEKSKDGGDIVLVILDEHTTITEDGETVGYRREGITSVDNPEHYGHCKVQFFNVNEHCYMDGSNDNGTFQKDGVNYVMKASVALTEWGAGHVMLSRQDDGRVLVNFPKAAGYVGTLSTLYENSASTSHVVSFKQQGKSFPTGMDVYLPMMSRAMAQDICDVEIAKGKSVMVRDNNNHLKDVDDLSFKWSHLITPSFSKLRLWSGKTAVDCRVGFVDLSFALKFLAFPFIVAMVLLLLVLGPKSPVKVDVYAGQYDAPFYSNSQLSKYPNYFAMLILVAFAYCVCKSLIALKLGYTYPYFEKMVGITPATTSLMLLLFFTMAMVLNFSVTKAMEGDEYDAYYDMGKKLRRRKWTAWTTIVVLFAAVIAGYAMLDRTVSQGVIDSYFPSQIYNFNFLGWRDMFGINDNHRSVPYTLILVEAVMLVVWCLQNCYCQSRAVREWFDNVFALWQRKKEDAKSALCNTYENYGKRYVDALREKKDALNENEWWKILLTYLNKVVNFGRNHFLLSSLLLVVLVAIAFYVDSVARPVLFVALIWAVLSLWDSIVLAAKALFPGHLVVLAGLAFIGPMMGNFGTAFITVVVVIGLCKALTGVSFAKENPESPVDTRHSVLFEMLIIATVYIVCAMVADNGYMTNYMGFLMAVLSFYFLMDRNWDWYNDDSKQAKNENRWVSWMALLAIVLFSLMPSICGKLFSTDEVNYSRFSRRMMLYSNFNDLQKSGFRYAENDAEFMTIMSHYMQSNEGKDPLSNEDHFLHSSVSSGQSPVVLNDLSVPVAFIGAYGTVRATTVFFLLLTALLLLVSQFSLGHPSSDGDPDTYLTRGMQWRLLAMFMWIGTSMYIYMSYIGRIPFTGRLLPGFGVDSVGEALETAILLAFMAVVTVRKKPINS